MAHHFTDTILNSFSDTTTNSFPLPLPLHFNPTELDTSTWSMMGFSEDSFFTQQQAPEINTNLSPNMLITSVFPGDVKSMVPAITTALPADHLYHFGSKRKSLDTPETSSANSSPLASSNGVTTIKNSTGGKGKKQKCNGNGKKNEEKPKDVVHVRARRGQATDSHSLAERVRRGKINERLRCLQDIVPGCQKTVGMAAMLDEIINYVQSLQNQVEFLSMKLTAASNFHDFNTEETMNIMIQRRKAWEAGMMMQKVLRERMGMGFGFGDGGITYPSTQHAPFDLSFGCFPTLPNNN